MGLMSENNRKGHLAVCNAGIIGVCETVEDKPHFNGEDSDLAYTRIWRGTSLFTGEPWATTSPSWLSIAEAARVKRAAAYLKDQEA